MFFEPFQGKPINFAHALFNCTRNITVPLRVAPSVAFGSAAPVARAAFLGPNLWNELHYIECRPRSACEPSPGV